jgi:hypothetical protein
MWPPDELVTAVRSVPDALARVGDVETDWTRGEARETCLEVLAAASVSGVPLEAGPDVLADAVGRRFVQEYYAEGRTMTRDWDLFQAIYRRAGAGRPWWCDGVTVHVNRLQKPFRWRQVPAELAEHGYATVTLPSRDADLHEYGVAASAVTARVAATDYYQPAGRLLDIRAGSVPVLLPVLPDRRGEVRNALRAVAAADPGTWPEWLAEQEPSADDYAAWPAALRRLHADQPERDEQWAALLVWLFDRAREAGVWSAEEWTYRWAWYVTDHSGLVPVAEVARECLAALPVDVAQASAPPRPWRETDPAEVRRARLTRALLRIAAENDPDPAATAELGRWRSETSWLP